MTKKQKNLIMPLMPNPPPNSDDSIKQALLQKAIGYTAQETIEEYACETETGNLVLCKKKITTKQFPPDLDAVQKLIELSDNNLFNVSQMTDFELEAEKQKLIEMIKNDEGEKNENIVKPNA